MALNLTPIINLLDKRVLFTFLFPTQSYNEVIITQIYFDFKTKNKRRQCLFLSISFLYRDEKSIKSLSLYLSSIKNRTKTS
ncbi:hypothetical protein P3X46_000343 [Hevea brasiliensis]|uniref:Uncharacterized protein n=1 Tax=Hevea brasiliensis TaxID=3981 RepID=A0ABQ9NAN5_HEVBR|nr:hypothetical protein P3X46_000343 [Hevea brasiliensis]